MQKSDLLHVFLALSDEELRNARKFLQSPYFNKREDVVVLFEFFSKEKKKSKPNWEKENAFAFIFPKAKYDDATMRHTMSYLLQLLYRFLSLQTWEKDSVRQELDLHKSLKTKNLDKIIEKKSDEILQLIESEPLRNAEHHFQKYLWQLERYAYIHRRRRTGDMYLREMSEEFSVYYFSEMLRQACLLFSHQTFNKESYDFSFFDEILVWVKNKELEKTLAIAVYFHSYLSMKNPDEDEHLFELKRLLTENWVAFPLDEIRDLYLIAINFCIKRQNKGQGKFVREGFELYKTGINNEILLENGVLSVFTYKNVHLLADKLGEYEWIVVFLEKYKHYLPAELRENHYNLNLAQYYFRRRQYEKAMPILQTIEFSDVLHNLDARRMLLIMYYDLGEFTVLDALLESFKAYTTRQTQLDYHRESYLNLIKFVKKLLLLSSMKKQEKAQFIQEIKDCSSVAERNWLLEQVN